MDFNQKERYIISALIFFLILLGGLVAYQHIQTNIPLPAIQEEKENSSLVIVHICGAVNKPGVYSLLQGKRIIDAVQKAGGTTIEADLDKLNLAALLQDGEKILVPKIISPSQNNKQASKAEANSLINLNTASQVELDSLPGIGPALAERIITYREQNNSFASVDDLQKVSGIGQKKFLQIKDLVTVQ